ncbi:amidohydrolase family protein [Desulfosporosinus sp. Sb-LF]|uniref:amidohydrolase family protein n=1 Tax=Desulfosporosinus sp. Sb-LF TaxID=2560027 RepID=UPI00107F2E3C|nr:amidohydrolase family protein [Desulfosporosinus sp. Sb-LF]TGE32372.1 amidohydrolase [Desulfosporosinus sp. Sb-LF]
MNSTRDADVGHITHTHDRLLVISDQRNGNILDNRQKICDAHIHLFPDRLMGAILDWFVQQGWTMPYRQSVDNLIKYLETIGVTSAFVLGYVHKKDMASGINLWLKELCDSHPWLHPFAALHQDDEHLEEILGQALDEWNFPGAKIHTFVQKVAANDKRLWSMYQMLIERRKGVILHLSGMPVETPYTRVEPLLDVLRSFPNLKVTIAHMGLPNDFSLAVKLAANYPNVYLDTAYMLGNPRFPMQEEWLKAIESYPEKFIFGTDFPVMDYSPVAAIQTINQLPLREEIKKQLFWDNAMSYLNAEHSQKNILDIS